VIQPAKVRRWILLGLLGLGLANSFRAQAITIVYDGDGNRVKKTVNGVTTWYLVDDRNPSGYAQVLEEYTGTTLSRVYNYGMALVSQRQVASGTVNYYGTDGHGSTRFLLNTSSGITDTYAYDAYGILIASTGNTPNNYRYTGQQWDADLGMYYLRARYLNPQTGRFWTMDSYEGDGESPLSLHKFLYCQNNSVNRIDPSGNKTVVVVTDEDNKGVGDEGAAENAALHLQSGGWSVTNIESGAFININFKFDGIILSGHGDETQSAAILVDVLEKKLKQTDSKLDVGIALSCHGFDFISKVSQHGDTTATALVIGYWGYSINSWGRDMRIGSTIDKWVKNPTYTSVSFGNAVTDGLGTVGVSTVKFSGAGIKEIGHSMLNSVGCWSLY
jgi:RHS repeat-associated protein